VLEVAVFAVGTLIAWLIVHQTRRWAFPLRLVDLPNQRSMHSRATPRGGGAAIVVVCLLGIAVEAAFGTRPEWPAFAGYLAGAALVVAVSLFDDLRSLPSAVRLAVQVLAAALMVAGLGSALGSISQMGVTWLVLALGLVWTVGLTNAYNFMDGIDGLAAAQGIVAGLGWTVLASISRESWLSALGLLVAAGCLGFILHNWSPAKIFMGDVGSAFMGFTFAFMSLAALRRDPQVALVGTLMLWPFLFDSSFSLLRRATRRENLFTAHRTHLYQRLVLAGWSHGSVTGLYTSISLMILALGIAWLMAPGVAASLLGVALILFSSLGLWLLVIRSERQASREAANPRPNEA